MLMALFAQNYSYNNIRVLKFGKAYETHTVYTASSSSVCGASGIPPNALQPTEAYCFKPAYGSQVHLQRKGGTMGEKWPVKFSLTNATSTSL
jgi:hypothetical protein